MISNRREGNRPTRRSRNRPTLEREPVFGLPLPPPGPNRSHREQNSKGVADARSPPKTHTHT